MNGGTDFTGKKRSLEQLRELDAWFDRQLEDKARGKTAAPQDRHSISGRKLLAVLAGLLFLAILPFFLLIRTSLFAYLSYGFNGWLALGTGIAATIALLLLYAIVLTRRMTQKRKINKYIVRAVAGLVLVYCGYGLLYISSLNVKNHEIRSYYRSLHPILRITLSTVTLADDELIITDMGRTPMDYRAMGLPVRERSLHYIQNSGYVHAVDIRTKGRAAWKNWLTEKVFSAAGLHTIRHVGTADHLHVSLPLNN